MDATKVEIGQIWRDKRRPDRKVRVITEWYSYVGTANLETGRRSRIARTTLRKNYILECEKPKEKTPWQEEAHRLVVDFLVHHGSPVKKEDSFYGWIAPNWMEIYKQVKEVGIDYKNSRWDDSEWDEFKGTFYEGDTRTVGIDATIVLKDRTAITFRWQGSPGEMLTAIVKGDL